MLHFGDETGLRRVLVRAFEAAVSAADPATVIAPHLPDPPEGRLVVVGAGKAAAAMAAAVEEHYGPEVQLEGLVIVPHGHARHEGRIEVAYGGHPVPDESGVAATARVLRAAEGCGPGDRLLVLVSGGGSALLCAPQGVGLEEKSRLTERLLRSGADIGEINAVRKHLSRVKGGRLAVAAEPAPVTALILSDVVGDDLSTIASGPTVPDHTVYADALEVLNRYEIDVPRIRAVLEEGSAGRLAESPVPGDERFEHVTNVLVGSNQQSMEAAAATLEREGFTARLLTNSVTGEAKEAGNLHAAIARQVLLHSQPFTPPCAILSGGETTVSVRGSSGRGGRNSEFALGFALAWLGHSPSGARAGRHVALLAADTDGRDGSEDNAGVFITPQLLEAIDLHAARGSLERNDSYGVFAPDYLLSTGPTGTNVNDLRIVLLGSSAPGGA